MTVIFFKGATAWEGSIGSFWFRLPFWRFVRCGCWPTFGVNLGGEE